MSQFSYVKYDEQAAALQQKFREMFERVAAQVHCLEDSRLTVLIHQKLEEAYMSVGKSIRDEQIKRTGKVDEQPERNNE